MPFSTPATPRGRTARQTAIRSNLDTFPLDTAAQAIENVYLRARRQGHTYRAGLSWYQDAHNVARTLASRFSLTTAQGAGILAALSPQTSWSDNIRHATDLCAALSNSEEPTGHTDLCLTRATAIFNLPAHRAHEDAVSAHLGGRKVRSFYRNILFPNTAGPVTVDRHAYAVASQQRTVHRTDRALERIGNYTVTAAAYRRVARTHGLLPHQLQAIVWCQHRFELYPELPAF